MAKVYKVEAYFIDYDDDYGSSESLQNDLERVCDRMPSRLSYASTEVSKRFEWNDDLKINKIGVTKEDFEKYFK